MSRRIALAAAATLAALALAACGNENAVPVEQARDMARLGSPDAPITVVEYSDYQCPYCARFHAESFADIQANYIDTGKVQWEFRDFPLAGHVHAVAASTAAYCAGEQGRYHEMSPRLYQNYNDLSAQQLQRLAGELGLDIAAFTACMDDRNYNDAINDNYNAGVAGIDGGKFSVSGTPTFIINGERMIVGAQPFTAFSEVFNEILQAQGAAAPAATTPAADEPVVPANERDAGAIETDASAKRAPDAPSDNPAVDILPAGEAPLN